LAFVAGNRGLAKGEAKGLCDDRGKVLATKPERRAQKNRVKVYGRELARLNEEGDETD